MRWKQRAVSGASRCGKNAALSVRDIELPDCWASHRAHAQKDRDRIAGGEIPVFDIWESQEAFEAFGATLLPILTAAGIELNEPMVARVHNEIKG
jgi:hypothetical protein